MTPTAIEDRVRAALRHRAEALDVADRPFDPDTALPDGVVVDLSPRSGRYRTSLLLAVAAVVLVVGGLAVATTRTGPDDGTDRAQTAPWPSTPVPGADEVVGGPLVPTVVPDGLLVETASYEHETLTELDFVQLFGRPDLTGPRVRLTYQPDRGESLPAPGPTVRGVPARALPSKEHPDTSSALSWSEGGQAVTADYQGLDQAAAIAFLEALVPTTVEGHPVLAAPAGAELQLVDQAAGAVGPARTTTLAYRDEAGVRTLQVRASEPEGDPSGFAHVATQYLAEVDDAGRLVAHDPRYNETVVAWPDGRRVIVTGDGSFGEDTLLTVALSVEPVSPDALAALRAEADARTVQDEAPLVALDMPVAEDLPPNQGQGDLRVEVRDEAAPYACISSEGGPLVCDQGREAPGASSIAIDAEGPAGAAPTWYVVAVSRTGPVDVTLAPPAPDTAPAVVPGARRAEVDGWTVVAVAVPEDVDTVWVGDTLQAASVARPGA